MLGKPKYKLDDLVLFELKDENDKNYKLTGKVYIIDAYGTFEQNEEVSYDIMVDSGDYPINYPCLFKHIKESSLLSLENGV